MIFFTVGHQLSFDRLMKAADAWAEQHPGTSCFAQVGTTGKYRPKHIEHLTTLTPHRFREKVEQSDLVVAHAGTGTILTALQFQRPVVVLARRAHLKETRNDHQWATAQRFSERGLVLWAESEQALAQKIEEARNFKAGSLTDHNRAALVQHLRAFVQQTAP